MAKEIPTFTTNAVTNVPSMGIVQQSGTRAMAQAKSAWGETFDAIGAFAGKKADEFMQFDMRMEGIKAAQKAGFDPMTMSNPITAADRIYRESAMQVYSIRLQNDIQDNMVRLRVENQLNPQGFRAGAEAYLKSTVSNLPADLQAGVSKYGESIAVRAFGAIAIETQSKVMQEAKLATDLQVKKLVSRFKLSDSEGEREVIAAELAATYANDPSIHTDELREAKTQAALVDMQTAAGEYEIMRGNTTPMRAVRDLEAAGIAVDNDQFRRLMNAGQMADNYEAAQANKRKTLSAAAISSYKSEVFLNLMQMKESGNIDEVSARIEQVKLEMAAMGAPVSDVVKFQNDLAKATSIEPETDDNYKAMIKDMIARGNPEAKGMIEGGAQAGTLSYPDYLELSRENEVAQSTPMQGTYGKLLTGMMNRELKVMDMAEMQSLSAVQEISRKEVNAERNLIRMELEEEFEKRVHGGESAASVYYDIINKREQIPNEKRRQSRMSENRRLYGDNVASKLHHLTDPTVKRTVIKIPSTKTNARTKEGSQKEIIIEGNLNESNALEVLQSMNDSNAIAISRGITPSYSEDLMDAISTEFNVRANNGR